MKHIIFAFCILHFAFAPVWADIQSVLDNGVGARAAAMGLAQVAAAEGPDAVYFNPAKLTKLEELQLSSTANEIYGANYTGVNLALPSRVGHFGLLILNAGYGSIPETNLDATTGRPVQIDTFNYNSRAYFISYAREFGPLAVGSNLKYLAENLHDSSGTGFGADLGLALAVSPALTLAAKFENLAAAQMKWSNTADALASLYKAGFALRPYEGKLLLTSDICLAVNRPAQFSYGSEFNMSESAALRAGFYDSRLTLGVGLAIKNLKFDYSYGQGNDYLEDSHRFSLTMAFFGKKGKRLEDRAIANLEPEFKEPEIQFKATRAAPGKIVYFKVDVDCVAVERVTLLYGGQRIKLYSKDFKTWKGDIRLAEEAILGEQAVKVYVADQQGHLYKKEAGFTVFSSMAATE